LDVRLVREGWLARVGPEATAVLAFLSIVADRDGVSFYGRDRMAVALDLDRGRLDRALERLLGEQLVAFRPWRPGGQDGVWQVLSPPAPPPPRGRSAPTPISDVISDLLKQRRKP
jgi:hypothetical protein